MIGFQVGATQFCLGILGAQMLSNSVLIGFMAAAALILNWYHHFSFIIYRLPIIKVKTHVPFFIYPFTQQ